MQSHEQQAFTEYLGVGYIFVDPLLNGLASTYWPRNVAHTAQQPFAMICRVGIRHSEPVPTQSLLAGEIGSRCRLVTLDEARTICSTFGVELKTEGFLSVDCRELDSNRRVYLAKTGQTLRG